MRPPATELRSLGISHASREAPAPPAQPRPLGLTDSHPVGLGVRRPDMTLHWVATDLKIVFVSSGLPRRSGMATFSADLMAAVKAADPRVTCLVAAIDEPNEGRRYGGEVRWRIRQGDALLQWLRLRSAARCGSSCCSRPLPTPLPRSPRSSWQGRNRGTRPGSSARSHDALRDAEQPPRRSG
jgi:hypothetical protein